MPLSYQLELSTEIAPLEFIELLPNAINFEWIKKDIDKSQIFTSGIILGVNKATEHTQNIINNAFGFIPQIDIWFRLNPNDPKYDKARKILLMFILNVLKKSQGEAVFLFNYEITFLAKIENILMFDTKMKNWFEDVEYEFAPQWKWLTLSSPLLGEPTVTVSTIASPFEL